MNKHSDARWNAALVVLVALPGLAWADVGDEVAVITPQPPGVQAYCAIGVAFDGVSLYVNRCGDHKVYRINPQTGSLLAAFDLAEAIPERPAGMAYDAKRGGLWIGTQKPSGLVAFDGCCEPNETPEECASQNRSMPVYFWSFDSGSVEKKFSVPLGLTNPATGFLFFAGPKCVMSGAAYAENEVALNEDDEVWITDDVSREIGVLRPTGDLVAGYNARTVNTNVFRCSGLSTGMGTL